MVQPSHDVVIRELEGLRVLARSLVHGDAEVDDLLQDTAIAALEHPPELDRPVRPWLATVLRNRWRMDRREASRRKVREQAVAPTADEQAVDSVDATVARARMLEKLAAALVALDEPFRTAVIRRYLDGESSADIARSLGVPAATVRWRLATGLERLRDALAKREQGWARVLLPFASVTKLSAPPLGSLVKGALLVKLKTKLVLLIALALLVGGVVYVTRGGGDADAPKAPVAQPQPTPVIEQVAAARPATSANPSPGQGKAVVEAATSPGGLAQGRVVNWSTGEGVGGADLTFSVVGGTGDGGVTTVRTHDDGVFELAPPAPGRFTLAAIAAQGFLPYAPEYQHSTVSVTLIADRAVKGITVFLFPALDYHGVVVDAGGKPVPGAKVRLLGTPAGEQAIDKLQTEWTSDKDGGFVFHAADEAVLEAERAGKRGWAVLDQNVQLTHRMTITLGDAPARDQTIAGHVVDDSGAPVPDVLVGAMPNGNRDDTRNPAFSVSGPDGAFKLEHLDRGVYELTGHADDRAPVVVRDVKGGTQNVTLVCSNGLAVSGTAATTEGDPVPSFTLTVFVKDGARRELVAARSIVDPQGRFSVHVPKGELELIAAASGLAPSKPTSVTVETTSVKDVKLTVSIGGVLKGVVQGLDGKPISRARVTREARGGGASAQPANAGTVTRADGTFELTGIPPGQFSVDLGAGGYNPKIEGGLSVEDGQSIGPFTYVLTPIVEGEQAQVELVGIGVALAADANGLIVNKIFDGGGKAAGMVVGDLVTAIDGLSTTELGMDGSIAKIRGVEGTTVSVTIKRGERTQELLVRRQKIRAVMGP